MPPNPTVFLCVALACFVLADDFEHGYCSPRYTRLCQGKGQHVACQFPETGPGPLCYNYTLVNFNTALKTFVLNYINRRRQRIASGIERVRGGARIPRPKLMMYVTWDRELATLAQRLADQCTFAHDSCRATVRYPHAGQTVGEIRWRRSSESDALNSQFAIRRILNAWWGERRRALPEHLTDPFKLVSRGAFWGHFSQIAVWSLQAVGCGAVCHGFDYSRLLLVCDFSHTNMLGQSTLNPGPQVPCPLHTSRRPKSPFPLLCAPVNYVEEEEDEDEDSEDRVVRLYSEEDRGHTPRYNAKTNYKYTTHMLDIEDLKYKNYPNNRIDVLKTQTESAIVPRKLTSRNKDIFLWSNKPIYTRTEHIEQTEVPRVTKVTVRYKFKDIDVSENTNLETTLNDIIPVHYKKLTTNPSVKDVSINKDKSERVRWQQHRDRPIRPGAYALLNIPVTQDQLSNMEAHKMITTSKTSLKLDQEDLEQLFQDTGFKTSLKLDQEDLEQLFQDTGFKVS